MSDDLELRLREAFHRESLPAAPEALHAAVDRVYDSPIRPRNQGRGRPTMALLAAAVALVAIGALAVGSGRFSRSEPTTPSVAPSIAAVPSTVPVLRIELAAPSGGVQATATPADMAEVVRVLEARVAATGVVGGTVVRAGPLRVTVELPGVADSHDPIVSRIGQIGSIQVVPLGTQPVAEGDVIDTDTRRPLFAGDQVESATTTVDGGATSLVLKLKPAAATAFAAYTSAHVGEFFAIALDGTVLLVPMIQNGITDGEVIVTLPDNGRPTPEAISALLSYVQSGELPVPLGASATVVDGPTPS